VPACGSDVDSGVDDYERDVVVADQGEIAASTVGVKNRSLTSRVRRWQHRTGVGVVGDRALSVTSDANAEPAGMCAPAHRAAARLDASIERCSAPTR